MLDILFRAGNSLFAPGVMPAIKGGMGIVKEMQHHSLAHDLKTTMVSARVYIDGAIASDKICTEVIRSAHSLYISLIINALQMDELVDGIHTVKELLKTVSSESYVSATESFTDEIGMNDILSFESLSDMEQVELWGKKLTGGETKESWGMQQYNEYVKNRNKTKLPKMENTQIVAIDKENHFPFGREVAVTLKHEKTTATINIFVQMQPYIINPKITPEFIKLDATPNLLNRWTQWRVGEISFWKDLIFNIDITNDRRKLIKLDKSGTLSEFLKYTLKKHRKVANNTVEAMKKAHFNDGGNEKSGRNIANSVMIFSHEAVIKTKADTTFDLYDKRSRDLYFDRTFAMFIFIIDPMYNKINMYINGMDAVGEYNFEQFKPRGKNNDIVDIITALNTMSKGRMPTF